MAQLVVHVRRSGEKKTRPAYAVWTSDSGTFVKAFGAEWEQDAQRMEAALNPSGSPIGRRGLPQRSPSTPLPSRTSSFAPSNLLSLGRELPA